MNATTVDFERLFKLRLTEETDPTPYEIKQVDDAVAEVLGNPKSHQKQVLLHAMSLPPKSPSWRSSALSSTK